MTTLGSWIDIFPMSDTVIAALIGFLGVSISIIATTWSGFRMLIRSQEAQAERDREAAVNTAILAERARTDERDYSRKVLAAALHAEIVALHGRLISFTPSLQAQKMIWEHMAADPTTKQNESVMLIQTYHVPIYEAHVAQLGLLGPSLASDVVAVLGRATTIAPKEPQKILPELGVIVARAMLEGNASWSSELAHVASRLAHFQGFIEQDPGTLYDFRQRQKTS